MANLVSDDVQMGPTTSVGGAPSCPPPLQREVEPLLSNSSISATSFIRTRNDMNTIRIIATTMTTTTASLFVVLRAIAAHNV